MYGGCVPVEPSEELLALLVEAAVAREGRGAVVAEADQTFSLLAPGFLFL
jgi:hypothetical protein